jgi:hypothetical protein
VKVTISDMSTINSGQIIGMAESLQAPTPAQALVQLAAYRIDLNPSHLSVVLQKMEDEYVTELWQLGFLDSINWQALGAPIGLIAAVRACLQEKETGDGSKIFHTAAPKIVAPSTHDLTSSNRVSTGFSKRRSTGMLPERCAPASSLQPAASRQSVDEHDFPPQSVHRRSSGIRYHHSNHDPLSEKGDRSMINKGSAHSLPLQPERRRTLHKDDADAIALDIQNSLEVELELEASNSDGYTGFPLRWGTLEAPDDAIAGKSYHNSNHDPRSMINKGSTHSLPLQPERRSTLHKHDADATVLDMRNHNFNHDPLPGKGNRSMINKGSTGTHSLPLQPERRSTLRKHDADVTALDTDDSSVEVEEASIDKYTEFPGIPLRRGTLEASDEATAQEVASLYSQSVGS